MRLRTVINCNMSMAHLFNIWIWIHVLLWWNMYCYSVSRLSGRRFDSFSEIRTKQKFEHRNNSPWRPKIGARSGERSSTLHLLFRIPVRLSFFFIFLLFLWFFRYAQFLFRFAQSSLSHGGATEWAVRDGSHADSHVTTTGWTNTDKRN